jgi:hypothetical protein
MTNFIVVTDTQDAKRAIDVDKITEVKEWEGELWKSIICIKGANNLHVKETVDEIVKKIKRETRLRKLGMHVFKRFTGEKILEPTYINLAYVVEFKRHAKYQNITTFYLVDRRKVHVYGSFDEICEMIKS